MNSQDTKRTAHQTRSSKAECCTELNCESSLRNNYFDGKRLTTDSFRVEQKYMLERRHLLNRALYGWGVVYGYGITTVQPDDPKKHFASRLKIGAGLALDKCGRELLQSKTVIEFADLIFLDENGKRIDPPNASSAAGRSNSENATHPPKDCWLLSAHYAERYIDQVRVEDSCRCEHQEWNHTCETVRYSLKKILCADCCDDFDCELNCDCGTGRCCDGSVDGPVDTRRPKAALPHKRGGCRCLCEQLTRLEPEAECGSLCEIEESCARVRVDVRNGVPLACIDLVRDDCDRLAFGRELEVCGPRRLVKRNDLLFDLIRGCDLTRISEIGWKAWHRREEAIPFAEFSAAFGQPDPESDPDRPDYLTRDFWVKFSRPVREDTLRPDCFSMTVLSAEHEGGWRETSRVPIVRVDTTGIPSEPHDPADHVRGARIVVAGAWVEDALRGRVTIFLGSETWVELEVRGDFIVDCNGQTVDADSVGLSPALTGNGAPGGTFLSTFRVAAEAPTRSVSKDSSRQKGVSQ